MAKDFTKIVSLLCLCILPSICKVKDAIHEKGEMVDDKLSDIDILDQRYSRNGYYAGDYDQDMGYMQDSDYYYRQRTLEKDEKKMRAEGESQQQKTHRQQKSSKPHAYDNSESESCDSEEDGKKEVHQAQKSARMDDHMAPQHRSLSRANTYPEQRGAEIIEEVKRQFEFENSKDGGDSGEHRKQKNAQPQDLEGSESCESDNEETAKNHRMQKASKSADRLEEAASHHMQRAADDKEANESEDTEKEESEEDKDDKEEKEEDDDDSVWDKFMNLFDMSSKPSDLNN